MVNYSEMPIHT